MTRAVAPSLLIIVLVSGQHLIGQNQPAAADRGQKPVREEFINVSYHRPPDSIPEMVTAATAIVLAEWTGRSRLVAEEVSAGGIPLPTSTAYTFRVLEILKLHPLLPVVGGEIDFEIFGGEKTSSTHVERTINRDAREFLPNRRYVLFLGWEPRTNELYLIWGPLGVYDVSDRRVTSLSPSWRRHDGNDVAAFVNSLRTASKK